MTFALLLTAAFALGFIIGLVVANEVRVRRRARGGLVDLTGVPARDVDVDNWWDDAA